MNVFDYTPITFILDFADDLLDVHLTNFLKFYETNMPPKIKKIYQDFPKFAIELKRKLRGFVPTSFAIDKK